MVDMDSMGLQCKILKQSQIMFGKWPMVLNSAANIGALVCWTCVNVLIRLD